MNCNMRFRPVVCADGRLLLPTGTGAMAPQVAWEQVRFGAACLHPERPSRAVFQLRLARHWLGTTLTADVALQLDEAALRRVAAELIELADEVALKPPRPGRDVRRG